MKTAKKWEVQTLPNGLKQFLPAGFDFSDWIDVTPVGAEYVQLLNTTTNKRIDCRDYWLEAFKESLPPVQRAQHDHRAGCGQDDNPYNKTTDHEKWQSYAWEMARLWNEDFKAENDLGRQQQESGINNP